MGDPVDQHITPKALLSKFTNSERRLYRINKKFPERGIGKPFFPKGIGYEPHFYTIQNKDSPIYDLKEDPYYVENVVNHSYEDDINKFWSIFESDQRYIWLGEKRRVSEILVHLRVRGPVIRNLLESEGGFEYIAQAIKNDIKSGRNFESNEFEIYRPLIHNPNFDKRFTALLSENLTGKDLHNQFLADRHLAHDDANKEFLVDRHMNSHWSIIRASGGKRFILPDTIGYVRNRETSMPMIGQHEWIFPLSGQMCLYMDSPGGKLMEDAKMRLRYVDGSDELIIYLNSLLFEGASDYAYGFKEDLLNSIAAEPEDGF